MNHIRRYPFQHGDLDYCTVCDKFMTPAEGANHVCPECEKEPPVDDVNRPSHYTQGKVECIDAIESALGKEGFIAFLRGQVIKYQWRLPHKGSAAKDAQKAKFYGDLLVERLKA